jgi:hypothetical protein
MSKETKKQKSEQKLLFEKITEITGNKNHVLASSRYLNLICNSIECGTLLSQLLYWDGKGKSKTNMIYKTNSELSEELGCNPRRLERLKPQLIKLGFVKTVVKRVARMTITHYLLQKDVILSAVQKIVNEEKMKHQNVSKSQKTSGIHERCNPGIHNLCNPGIHERCNVITENTTENTFTDINISKDMSFPAEKEDKSDLLIKESASKTDKYDLTSAFAAEQEILDFWNAAMKEVKSITKHRKLSSKVCSSFQKHYTSELQLLEHIDAALTKYSCDRIKQAIRNYKTVLTDDRYYYTVIYNLAQFLSMDKVNDFDDISDDTFKNYKFKELDEIAALRKSFQPTTVNYNSANLFDKNAKTYYGFPLPRIDSYLSWLSDIKSYGEDELINKKEGYFNALELVITGLLWNFKKLETDFYETNLKYCMNLWNKYKLQFQEVAKRMRENT